MLKFDYQKLLITLLWRQSKLHGRDDALHSLNKKLF